MEEERDIAARDSSGTCLVPPRAVWYRHSHQVGRPSHPMPGRRKVDKKEAHRSPSLCYHAQQAVQHVELHVWPPGKVQLPSSVRGMRGATTQPAQPSLDPFNATIECIIQTQQELMVEACNCPLCSKYCVQTTPTRTTERY